jgi:hypothetical protein
MVLATCAGFGVDLTNKYMKETFGQCGFNVVSSLELYIASMSEKEKSCNHEKTIKAFNKFITSIKSGQKHKPTFYQLVYFNIFKSISELNKKKGKADYQFYKDKINFYYDTKINFFKNMMAKWIAGKIIRKMMMNR